MTHLVFHAHLDKCEQCCNNPFDLCPVGNVILMAAVAGHHSIDPEQWIPSNQKPGGGA